MQRTLVISLLGLALAAAAFAQSAEHGTWTASQQDNGKLNLQVRVDRENHHSDFGSDYELSELGLKPEDITGASHPVKFHLTREAGTLAFQGTFERGDGSGPFDYTPNAEYFRQLGQLGYSDATDHALSLAMLDVSLAYAREFANLGFPMSVHNLMQGKIFKIDKAYVDSMRAGGFTDLSFRDLVQFKIFKVTPEYVQDMQKQGFNMKDLSPHELVQFRIFKVDPDQLADLKSVGYSDVSARDLIQFRIHHVDSAFIREVQAKGFTHPEPHELIRMKLMGTRQRGAML